MDNKQRDIWLKAAVIGSIWASFEIVFGSFFHSLRLPFAGTFLTFSSVVLLIAFSYKWHDKNLYLKAGIVAALMRSLMPTSVILGPLIGILTEAFLFQLAIRFFGRNFVAFAWAGILAMFSAILHKVVSIILIYGWDIVKILDNLYQLFLRMSDIQLPENQLFELVLITYTFLGLTAVAIGQYTGRHLQRMTNRTITIDNQWKVSNDLFDIAHFTYHSKYIWLHIAALISFPVSLEMFSLSYLIIPIAIYLIFVVKRYGKSLRRLAKPLFWLQLAVIVLMAVWLWDDKIQGLLTGIKMILRAVLVVSIFTAISVELKNPLVKALLYQKGYSQLYATLGLATSAVPFILKNISVHKKSFLNPYKILTQAIGLSDVLLHEFKRQIEQKHQIFVISGETRSGKTTFLKEIVKKLREQNSTYNIGGVIAHGLDKNGERYGFEIENLTSGKKQLLATREVIPDSEKVGRFYFSKKVLKRCNEQIAFDLNKLDMLVIDEVGYLELKGSGWFTVIEKALQKDRLNMIFVVRKRILEQVLRLWQDHYIEVVDIKDTKPEDLLKKIRKE